MPESLSITYVDYTSSSGADDTWCVVEALPFKDEVADMRDAAALLDKAFNTDPCTGEVIDNTEEEEQLFEPALTEEEFLAEAAKIAPSNACLYDDDYVAVIEVYRSNLTIDYTFRIDIGEVGPIQEDLTAYKSYDIECDESISVKLKYPIYYDYYRGYDVHIYNEKGEEISFPIQNNNIVFGIENPYTGNIKVTHYSKYDQIKVRVPFDPTDENPPRPRALVFYDKLVYDDEVEPPSIDTANMTNCIGYDDSNTNWDVEITGPGSGDCSMSVNHYTYCRCSDDKVARSWREQLIAPCDTIDWGATWVFDGYEPCPDDAEDVYDNDFYFQTCCVNVPFNKSLPLCRKTTSIYYGGAEPKDKEAVENYYGAENVVYIPIGPEDGPCGKHIVEYDVSPKNCCDIQYPILWLNQDDPYLPVEHNKDYTITIHAGTAPFVWEVVGTGLFISGNETIASLHVDECFCNPGLVIVTDACGEQIVLIVYHKDGSMDSISDTVLSDNYGGWYQDGLPDPPIIQKNWVYGFNNSRLLHSIQSYIRGSLVITGAISQEAIEEQLCDVISAYGDYVADPLAVPNRQGYIKCPDDSVWYDADNISNAEGQTEDLVYKYWYPNTDRTDSFEYTPPVGCESDEMEIDYDNSFEVLADNFLGIVFWTGGVGPFTVHVSGQNVFVDPARTLTQTTTDGRMQTIYSGDTCGTITVTVYDTCGKSVFGTFKAAEGKWEKRGGQYASYQDECPEGWGIEQPHNILSWAYGGEAIWYATGEKNNVRVTEGIYNEYWGVGVRPTCAEIIELVYGGGMEGLARCGAVANQHACLYPYDLVANYPCGAVSHIGWYRFACVNFRSIYDWEC